MRKKKVPKNRKLLRNILLVLLWVPTIILFVFMFGEILGGDPSGFGHSLQIIPLLILSFLVCKFI